MLTSSKRQHYQITCDTNKLCHTIHNITLFIFFRVAHLANVHVQGQLTKDLNKL